MEISLARVTKTTDGSRTGDFLAEILSNSSNIVTVRYVSPSLTRDLGGFYSFPGEGTIIIVCRPTDSNDWFYLGTTSLFPEEVHNDGSKVADRTLELVDRIDPLIFRTRGLPMRSGFLGNFGQGLQISDEFNPDYYNVYTELKGVAEKSIKIDDAPQKDSIFIDSGVGSRLAITGLPQGSDNSLPNRGIEVDTLGDHRYISREGQTDIVVGWGGQELEIHNAANGTGPASGTPEEYGNVTVQSDNKDIHLFTKGDSGRIFIECLNTNGSNQHIQIETNGNGGAVVIKTKGTISLQATEGSVEIVSSEINIKSSGKLNLESGGAMSLKSGGDISLDGTTVNLNGGTTNVGGTVNLASTGAAANSASISSPNQQSVYGNEGISTFYNK